jgi:phage tail-like protein
MSFSNLEYLYEHLPARFRRDDEGLFLKRFLSTFCAELDACDQLFDTFHAQINPDTAPANFIDFWLWALFGWAWFPEWFTLAQRRSFFRNIATHYARRGTARGVIAFLLEFGIRSRVVTRPTFYDEWTPDDGGWLIDGPLVVVIQIFPGSAGIAQEQTFYGEWTLGEDAVAEPGNVPTRPDVDQLLRFQQPLAQHFIIEEKVAA